jgi:calreticulin
MKAVSGTCILIGLLWVSSVLATVYYKEEFNNMDGWVESKQPNRRDDQRGKFKLATGKFYGDPEINLGYQTSTDARFYVSSSKMASPFVDGSKTLVFQFSVKHEQELDCGGGYLKLLPDTPDFDPESFTNESPYGVMFGPDICGSGTRKVHLIFTYKGKNYLWKKDARCETDTLTHVYTLVVDGTTDKYEMWIDMSKKEYGSIAEDWDILPAKQIADPSAKKPADWVDEKEIVDVTDTKPADWDEIPENIPDPKATKPDDWNDDEDGKWEPPMIPNPEYKGKWKAKMIPNPAYKGEWKAPMIDNPDYFQDDHILETILGKEGFGHIGIEIWQVKSGTIFDNVLVTDSFQEAKDFAEATWGATKEGERKMKNQADEEDRKKRDEERRKREDEDRKRREEEDAEKDEEDEEEDEDFEPADAMDAEARKEKLEEIKRKTEAKKAADVKKDEL